MKTFGQLEKIHWILRFSCSLVLKTKKPCLAGPRSCWLYWVAPCPRLHMVLEGTLLSLLQTHLKTFLTVLGFPSVRASVSAISGWASWGLAHPSGHQPASQWPLCGSGSSQTSEHTRLEKHFPRPTTLLRWLLHPWSPWPVGGSRAGFL